MPDTASSRVVTGCAIAEALKISRADSDIRLIISLLHSERYACGERRANVAHRREYNALVILRFYKSTNVGPIRRPSGRKTSFCCAFQSPEPTNWTSTPLRILDIRYPRLRHRLLSGAAANAI